MPPLWAGATSGEGSSMALNMGAQMSGMGENPCPCCELTLSQRLTGFASCFGIGMLISFLSTMQLWSANYTSFATMYTIGNIVALLSMGFLMGPKSQCQSMFAETRRVATSIYLLFIIITMAVAFGYDKEGNNRNGKVALILLCVLAQFLSLCWYTLSYIPFARQAATACLGSCCKMNG